MPETVLVQKLSQVDGVGAVTTEGGQRRAVRLEINPARLAGLGLSMEDVRNAVAATTSDLPKGSLERRAAGISDRLQRSVVRGRGVSERGDCIRNNAPVLLRDIGIGGRWRGERGTGRLVMPPAEAKAARRRSS